MTKIQPKLYLRRNNSWINKRVGLFKDIDLDESFGISKAIANLMYHLDTLLNTSQLKKTSEQSWKLEGTIQNSYNENIILTYEFDASSEKEAETLFESYKTMMKGKGIRSWMAYWMIANARGKVECACPMIEIMKCVPKQTRKTDFFGGNEKKEFWEISKKLRRTYISIEKTITRNNKPRKQWIEQPLLTILGGEKEIEESETYPIKIAFKVLANQKKSKGFAPAIYQNKSLNRPTNRMFLIFIIETRANQRERGEKYLTMDWPFLFRISNLENTASSNPRAAKARIRKEIEALKEEQLILEYEETQDGIRISPKTEIYSLKK